MQRMWLIYRSHPGSCTCGSKDIVLHLKEISSDNKTPDLPMKMINIAYSSYHFNSRQITLAEIFKLNQVLMVFQVFRD